MRRVCICENVHFRFLYTSTPHQQSFKKSHIPHIKVAIIGRLPATQYQKFSLILILRKDFPTRIV